MVEVAEKYRLSFFVFPTLQSSYFFHPVLLSTFTWYYQCSSFFQSIMFPVLWSYNSYFFIPASLPIG